MSVMMAMLWVTSLCSTYVVILSQASLTEDCHVVGYMLHRILFTPGTRFNFFPYCLQLFAICYVKQSAIMSSISDWFLCLL